MPRKPLEHRATRRFGDTRLSSTLPQDPHLELDFKSIFEQVPVPCLLLSTDLMIIIPSDAYLRLGMTTRSDVIGKKVFDVFPDPPGGRDADGAANLRALFSQVLETRQERWHDAVRIRKDGHQTEVSWCLAPVLDAGGQVHAILAVELGIAGCRRTEAELSERTRQLQDANRDLEALVFAISHDLRAPLRAMDGFSSLLGEDCAQQLDEQGQHYLSSIRSGAQRMGTMIDELLQMSRVARGEPHRETVDLTSLARQITAGLTRESPERHVEFLIADGMTAQADPLLVQVVLEHLLSNAWRFTSTRRRARIEVGEARRGGQREFYVRDNGVGFDMAYAGQLFKPFQRLHRPEEFPGSGMGMAIAQRIITRHGGRIWASAQPDHGATFSFTLAPSAARGAGGANPESSGDGHD